MADEITDLSEDAAEFRCLVPFPDGSSSFVNGFEAGMVWQRMVSGETPLENPVAYHEENLAVFQRMADAQGYEMEAADPDGGWVVVTFTRRPKRFRLIDGGQP